MSFIVVLNLLFLPWPSGAISVGSYILLTSLLIVGRGCLFENFLTSWYKVLQTHLVYFLPQFTLTLYIHCGTFNVSID